MVVKRGYVLLVSGENRTTTKDVCYISAVDVGYGFFEGGYLVEIFRGFEIEALWLCTVPRPDEVSDLGQPPDPISKPGSLDLHGEGERGRRHDRLQAIPDLCGWVVGPAVLDFKHIEKEVEIGELANCIAHHLDRNLLVDRSRGFSLEEGKVCPWEREDFLEVEEFGKSNPGD